ncbi:MAG: DUF2911 domain-containing protein, partial [Gemmatimonadetes bacterium]|nr:DUF2911 domain-containing protein [Gemmatimonadota bacterium]
MNSIRIPALVLSVCALALLAPQPAATQIVASERATLTQQVTGVEIEIDYSRPSARGREPLFGGVVPWG